MVKSYFVYFIFTAALVATSIANSRTIRLQSTFNKNKLLYTHPNRTTSARIYSNQLGDQVLNKLFVTKRNNQEVILTDEIKGRQQLCSSMKYCEEVSKDQHYCILALNVVFYAGIPVQQFLQRTTRHYSQIDSVKLKLVVSDFTGDSLNFKKSDYNFQLNSESLLLAGSDLLSLGMIKAELNFNVDFNPAIEYYLDFDADTKAEYIDLFDVEASTGQLTLNRKNFAANDNNFNKEFVFFVDAQVQCATESPLRRRTTIRVHVANLNATNMHVTNLVETSDLTRSFECIKLTHRDFELNTKLALTQVSRNCFKNFLEKKI
jgi:hypothetical protein